MQEKNYVKNSLEIIKLENKKMYLESLQQERTMNYEIAIGKFQKGYVTKIELDEIELQQKEVQRQIENVNAQIRSKEEISQMYGTVSDMPEILQNLPNLVGNFEEDYVTNNLQIEEYDYKISEYEKSISNAAANEDTENLRVQKELLEIERQNYINTIHAFVKEQLVNYHVLCSGMEQTDDELEILQEKISIYTKLLNAGEVPQYSLANLTTRKSELEYHRMETLCDGIYIKYVLEHRIYE